MSKRKREDGAAAVGVSRSVLPIFIALLFGIIQYGFLLLDSGDGQQRSP